MKTIPQLEHTIEMLEKQRPFLGDEAVDMAVAALQKEIAELETAVSPLKQLAGERKLITVMFADLSGFTALTEQEDPEIVRKLVNDIFERLARVIMHYEGFIEKYIGDEIMAIFGAPVSCEDHAERALGSALDMMKELASYNREQDRHLELHIGINTGRVVTGLIGARQHQQYGVTGDAVNLAARLKQAAKAGQIFVGAETRQMAQYAFDFSVLPPMRFKGKSDPIPVYQLQDRKSEQVERWVMGLSSPLVGREKELNVLSEMLNELERGKGRCLAIIGEAGIGKSRLVAEFKKRWENKVCWVEGRALSYARESSFLPVREILAKLTDVPAEASTEEERILLQNEFEILCGSKAKEHFPFLAYLMQLPLTHEEEERVRYFPTAALNNKVHAAVQVYLLAKTRHKPLVVVWEDLHWADPASLRLIEALMKTVNQTPLVSLLLFRPVKEAAVWALHQQIEESYSSTYQTLELQSLSKDQIRFLTKNLMNATTIDSTLEQLIFNSAEGNPLFVEELVRSLMDRNILNLEGQEAKITSPIGQIEAPTTLQGVIASRIDRLESDDKFLFQTASVLGRIFNREVLSQLLVKADFKGNINSSLNELLYRELIRERATDTPETKEFIFKHAYIYEVAYKSLLLSHREHLHQLAAATFEALAGDRSEDYASVIGFHYERTSAKEKAIHYLKLGAYRARKRHVNDEAINLYERAIAQWELYSPEERRSPEQRLLYLTLVENLGDVQEVNGQHVEAITTFEKALKSFDQKEVLSKARLYRKAATSCNSARQVEKATTGYDHAEELLKQVKPANRTDEWWNEWIEVHLDRLLLFYWTSKHSEMETLLLQILNDVNQKGTPGQQARFFQSLVMFRFRKERMLITDETLQFAEQMIEATRKTNNERVIAMSKFIYGFALLLHDDLEKGIVALRKSEATARRMGDIINLVRSLNYLAFGYRRLGNIPETRKLVEQTLEIARDLHLVEYLASANADKSWLAWKAGDLQSAEIYAKECLIHWRMQEKRLGDRVPFLWRGCWPLIAALHAQGNWAESIDPIKVILEPTQRPMEPEIQVLLRKIVEDHQAGPTVNLERDIGRAIGLAGKYRHL